MSFALLLLTLIPPPLEPTPGIIPEFMHQELAPTGPTGGLKSERRFFARRANEFGKVSFGAHQRAVEQAASMGAPSSPQEGPEDSGQNEIPLAWTEVGPSNIGGRVRDIVVRPSTSGGGSPATMWTISPGGGIWTGTESGRFWNRSEGLPNLNFSVMTSSYDPSTDQILLFAGTGEGFWTERSGLYNISAARGAGIYTSTNEGVTWSLVRDTMVPEFSYLYSILVHPSNPSILLASTPSGVYRINTQGSNRRRTPITRVSTVPLSTMMLVPGTDTVIAGTANSGMVARGAGFGSNWSFSAPLGNTANVARTEVAICQSDPTVVYANVADTQGTSDRADDGNVWRSTNGGVSFTLLPRPASDYMNAGNYANAIWVSPTNPNHVIVGGLDLRRSIDGGQSWTQITEWERYMANRPFVKESAHADIHRIVSSPEYGSEGESRLWIATDAGVFETSDPITAGVFDWIPRNDGIGITQFYYASVSPDGKSIIGGTQDNGTIRLNDGDSISQWETLDSGDGGSAYFSPTTANLFYTSYIHGRVRRTTLSGTTILTPTNSNEFEFTPKTHYFPGIVPGIGEQLLICGLTGLHMINPATHPANTAPQRIFNAATEISEVDRATFNPELAWIGGQTLGVLKTNTLTDGNQNDWIDVTPTGFPSRRVSDIEIVNSNRVYVALMGYEYNNLWRTSDGGNTWQNLHLKGKLPQVPISSVKVLRSQFGGNGQVDALAIGTDLGVFLSLDSGNSWRAASEGMGQTVIEELFFDPERAFLYAATHGRGIFRSVLPVQAEVTLAGRGTNLSGGLPVGLPSIIAHEFTTPDAEECAFWEFSAQGWKGYNFQFGATTGSRDSFLDGAIGPNMGPWSLDGSTVYRLITTGQGPWATVIESKNRVSGLISNLGTIPLLPDTEVFLPRAFDMLNKRIYGSFERRSTPLLLRKAGYVSFQGPTLQTFEIPTLSENRPWESLRRADGRIQRYIPVVPKTGEGVDRQLFLLDSNTNQYTSIATATSPDYLQLFDIDALGRPLYAKFTSTETQLFLGSTLVATIPGTSVLMDAGVSGIGDRIVVQRAEPPFGRTTIMVDDVLPNGSLRRILSENFSPGTIYPMRLSRDGRSLLFSSQKRLLPFVSGPASLFGSGLYSYRIRLAPGPR